MLTSNGQSKLGEIQPAMPWQRRIPCLLDWNTLYNDTNAGKQGDYSGRYNEKPDDTDLDLASNESEEKDTDGALADTNDHKTSHLAENFPLDGGEVSNWITDLLEESP